MTRIFLLLILITSFLPPLPAQNTASAAILPERPSTEEKTDTLFKGIFYNETIGLNLHLDLYEESLEVPDMEFLGAVHGYMEGSIYGVWMLLSFEIKGNHALLKFTNDLGSETQLIRLTHKGGNEYFYQTEGSNEVRRVVGRKLVKIEPSMPMKKRKL